jgi:hypothetical protein
MSSGAPNAYEQLKLLQSTYVSSMKYSNTYNFSTFEVFKNVSNLTSVDDYYSAKLLATSVFWLACLMMSSAN